AERPWLKELHLLTAKPVIYVVKVNEDGFERNACSERMVPADYLAQLPVYPPNPEDRELVAEMKQAIIDLMHQHGGAHLQIGKLYPHLTDRNPAAEHRRRPTDERFRDAALLARLANGPPRAFLRIQSLIAAS
ncbi:MAG: hypothetical protein JJT93_11595, partial [Gammaproteobacteria bacterium]|nr:hypothetical protein [Gammaproteobacteria bacterium]